MNLTLTRMSFDFDGIFGELRSAKELLAYTLEHAYDDGSGRGSYAPKIPAGTYICKRSMHRLEGMKNDFEAFEVMNVPGHTDCLIHWGNFNADSSGCICLGEAIAPYKDGKMITNSKAEFAAFMRLQAGVNEFQLTVVD